MAHTNTHTLIPCPWVMVQSPSRCTVSIHTNTQSVSRLVLGLLQYCISILRSPPNSLVVGSLGRYLTKQEEQSYLTSALGRLRAVEAIVLYWRLTLNIMCSIKSLLTQQNLPALPELDIVELQLEVGTGNNQSLIINKATE